MKCDTCKFYNPKGPGAGECRRNAPRPDRTFDGAASMRWPQVSRDAWCGEYEVDDIAPRRRVDKPGNR